MEVTHENTSGVKPDHIGLTFSSTSSNKVLRLYFDADKAAVDLLDLLDSSTEDEGAILQVR